MFRRTFLSLLFQGRNGCLEKPFPPTMILSDQEQRFIFVQFDKRKLMTLIAAVIADNQKESEMLLKQIEAMAQTDRKPRKLTLVITTDCEWRGDAPVGPVRGLLGEAMND